MSCICNSLIQQWRVKDVEEIDKITRNHHHHEDVLSGDKEKGGENNTTATVEEGDDLFLAIRKPLWIGSILGLLPIRGVLSTNVSQLKFSWFHWRTGLTTFIVLVTTCNSILITQSFCRNILKRDSFGDVVSELCGLFFYGMGTAIYNFFLWRSKQVLDYFNLWSKTSKEIHKTLFPDIGLKRDSNLITLLVLGSCFGENVMFHFHKLKPELRSRIGTLTLDEWLQDFYKEGSGYLAELFPFNAWIALIFLVLHKLTLYAWNFGDVFLMMLSRAIYGRFEGLNHFLESQLSHEEFGYPLMIKKGSVNWKSFRQNFLHLINLVDETNRVFGPLIWLSSVTNILFVCNQLFLEISTSSKQLSLVSQIYVAWSILHLIIRTFVVNLMAAKINVSAHRIFHTLQHCTPEEYEEYDDVRRLEQYLGSRNVGLSGSGCFVITVSFILKIISAIFTLEVVLIQSQPVNVSKEDMKKIITSSSSL